MEIRTCEEYVIRELENAQREIIVLKDQLKMLKNSKDPDIIFSDREALLDDYHRVLCENGHLVKAIKKFLCVNTLEFNGEDFIEAKPDSTIMTRSDEGFDDVVLALRR